MRRSALVAGSVMWLLAGAMAIVVYGPRFQRSDVTAAQAAEEPTRIENPSGRQAIVIRKADPEPIEIPDDWRPPLVKGWTLTNQLGQTVTAEQLKGKPYVCTFIFTRCTTHCPILVRKVYDLEERLRDVDLRFITVSVDPDYDTVDHLAKFADIYTEDDDRWMFLTGSKDEILKLAQFGFRQQRLEPLDPETFIGPQAAHSLRLMHVGADGRIVGSYHFQNEDDMLALRQVLRDKSETREEHRPLPPAEMLETAFESEEPSTEEASDESPLIATEASDNVQPDDPEASVNKAAEPSEALNENEAAGDPLSGLPDWAARLPAVNASLNSLATLLLLAGFVAIKRRKARVHRNCMVATLVVSAVFLGCYLVYHWALGAYTDSHGKPFEGTGIARIVYFSILIPHVLLAAAVPVLAGIAVWRAVQQRWDAHKKVVKWAYPIWLFVSVTGVVIYGMLYHWPAAA